jgi:hypothetical protein
MIYDVHTHIGLDPGFYLKGWWPYAATVQDLLERMDAYGVDKAVCFPFTIASCYDQNAFVKDGSVTLLPGCTPYENENRLLVQEVQRIDLDKRLRVLAMFDPSRKPDAQVKRLEPMVKQITGLKLQATMIQSNVSDLLKEGRGLMELAAAHDLPVLIHTSILPKDTWSQAADCLDVADAFPTVRFNMAHSLRFSVPNLKRAAQMDNVWIDCSAHLAHCELGVMDSPVVAAKPDRVDADYSRPAQVLQAVASLLRKDQYMWGSDSPYMSWCDDGIRMVYGYGQEVAVLNELPSDLKQSMAETGPLQWLGRREEVHP